MTQAIGTLRDYQVWRWLRLAEKRLDHVTDMFDSGRWRRFYREPEFLEVINNAKATVETWRKLMPVTERAVVAPPVTAPSPDAPPAEPPVSVASPQEASPQELLPQKSQQAEFAPPVTATEVDEPPPYFTLSDSMLAAPVEAVEALLAEEPEDEDALLTELDEAPTAMRHIESILRESPRPPPLPPSPFEMEIGAIALQRLRDNAA